MALMQMILGPRNNDHLDAFVEFLGSIQGENVRIAQDQWVSFLDFSVSVPADCKGYEEDDENCAWPVLIDEYCAWVKAKNTGK